MEELSDSDLIEKAKIAARRSAKSDPEKSEIIEALAFRLKAAIASSQISEPLEDPEPTRLERQLAAKLRMRTDKKLRKITPDWIVALANV